MTTLQITDTLLFLDRSEWDTSGAPRQRISVDPQDREYAIMHHVVATDIDLTPNLWEDLDEIKRRMRGLRVVRPDLGLPVDNPYNWTGFLMADSFMGAGGLVVCEGRGHLYRGAHTKYHNRTGVALSIYADLQTYDTNVLPYIPQISRFWGWVKYELALPNLTIALPPNGGEVWYHNQLNQKNGLSHTSCCGRYLIEKMHLVHITDPNEEGDEMINRHTKLFHTWGPAALWVIDYISDVPMWRRWIRTQVGATKLIADLGAPANTTEGDLSSVPVIGPRP